MRVIDIDSLRPSSDRAALFQGIEHDAQTTFFIVNSKPGHGVNKHRHPYEEIFVVLEGKVVVTVGNETLRLKGGNVIIISPNTWHEFTNKSKHNALMVNIHASPKLIQDDSEEAS